MRGDADVQSIPAFSHSVRRFTYVSFSSEASASNHAAENKSCSRKDLLEAEIHGFKKKNEMPVLKSTGISFFLHNPYKNARSHNALPDPNHYSSELSGALSAASLRLTEVSIHRNNKLVIRICLLYLCDDILPDLTPVLRVKTDDNVKPD